MSVAAAAAHSSGAQSLPEHRGLLDEEEAVEGKCISDPRHGSRVPLCEGGGAPLGGGGGAAAGGGAPERSLHLGLLLALTAFAAVAALAAAGVVRSFRQLPGSAAAHHRTRSVAGKHQQWTILDDSQTGTHLAAANVDSSIEDFDIFPDEHTLGLGVTTVTESTRTGTTTTITRTVTTSTRTYTGTTTTRTTTTRTVSSTTRTRSYALVMTTTTTWQRSFDCKAGEWNWRKGWSQEKKDWCCERGGTGAPGCEFDCNAGKPLWKTGWSIEKKNWCCKHEQFGCEFDCNAGRPMWSRGWSEEKKEYCCKTENFGCKFDCEAGKKLWRRGWSEEKKEFCCRTTNFGCEFDCEAGKPLWKTGWSDAKKGYCCQNFDFGCEEKQFDCKAGLPMWKTGWSQMKKNYCCKHEQVGCQDWLLYDCAKGVETWRTGWTVDKKHYCCDHADVGCEEPTPAPAPTAPPPPPPPQTTLPAATELQPPQNLMVTTVREMSGERCHSIKNASSIQGSFPLHCKKPVSSYKHDDEVRKQCDNIEYWERLAKEQPDDSNSHCEIDPKTKKMKCVRKRTCTGGEVKTARDQVVISNLTYSCGSTCKGALLVDCCNTCREKQRDPASLGVSNVICEGCADEELLEAASTADCVFKDGAFHCSSSGSCASGVVETKCRVSDIRCEVYPCDSCTDPQLKGQCCKNCLEKLCSDNPEDRMSCQGCETLPSGQWWPWR